MTLKLIAPLFLFAFIILGCKKEDETDCSELIQCYLKETCNAEVDPTFNGYTGYDVSYYPISGSLVKKSEGNYTDGQKNGYWKYYYVNGNIEKEGNYTNGQTNGYWKKYFENGSLSEEGNYSYCKRDGYWKFYSNTVFNQIKFEGSINQDVLTGTWKEYDETTGKLTESTACN